MTDENRDLDLSPEIRALQDQNKARLAALSAAGAQFDTIGPYLITMLEELCLQAGLMETVIERHERGMAVFCDEAEKAVQAAKNQRKVDKLFAPRR